MKKHKTKLKPSHRVSVNELLSLAESHRDGGRVDEAIRVLRRAEEEVQHNAPWNGGKGILGASPEEVRKRIAQLLATLFSLRAEGARDPVKKLLDLEEAAKRMPSAPRTLLKLGACYLAAAKAERAFEFIGKAHRILPRSPILERAFALAQLAVGHTREVKEWLQHLPERAGNVPSKRMAVIRDLMQGNHSQAILRLESRSQARPSGEGTLQEFAPEFPGQKLDGELWTCLMKGLLQLTGGDVEGAGKQLSALPPLNGSPSRSDAAVLATQLFYSGVLNVESRRFKQAASDLQEALRLGSERALALPWLTRVPAYFHRIGVSAVRGGDLPLAIDCWQRILQVDPQDKVAAANLKASRPIQANLAWRTGDLEKAAALWKESLQVRPQDEQLLKNAALGCERLGRTVEAISFWKSLAQRWRQQLRNERGISAPEEAGLRGRLFRLERHLVDLMVAAGRPTHEVLNELDSALKIDTTHQDFHRMYADLLLEMGRPQQALKHLNTIERNHGESADVLVEKGMTFEMMRQWSAAQKSYERALELAPSHAVARHSLLLLLGGGAVKAERKGEPERAIEICNQQLGIDPHYLPAQAHLAGLFFSLGDVTRARRATEQIVEADPSKAERHAMAGSLYLQFHFNKQAESEFNQAIELEPSDHCYFQIGQSYLEHGKVKKALKHFGLASTTASFALLMDISDALLRAEYPHEAEQYLDLAIYKEPWNPEGHLNKSFAWAARMKLEEAWREVNEAERLARERTEFAGFLDEARSMKRAIQEMRQIQELIMGKKNSLSPLSPKLSDAMPPLAKFGRPS